MAAPPPPPSDPAVTLQSLEMVKRISDNVYMILASDNMSKLFDTMNVIQSPGKVTHVVKVRGRCGSVWGFFLMCVEDLGWCQDTLGIVSIF